MLMLDARLAAVAKLIPQGSSCVDIGTDHGYLPAWLIANHVCQTVIAADVNQNPLEAARRTAVKYATLPQTQLILSDGLSQIPDWVETVVIAGMGGELIASLLGACAWIKDEKKCLILQPMTHADTLRRWLYQTGFAIVDEVCAVDGEHLYCIMKARYTGTCIAIDDRMAVLGMLAQKTDAAARSYVARQIQKVRKALSQLKAAQKTDATQQKIARLTELLSVLQQEESHGNGI